MNNPDFSLKDKVALVTGASKGIGADLARALAAAGAQVALAARDEAKLHTVAAEIAAAGGEAATVAMDVSDVASIEAGVAAAVDRFGRLDILVNNAGIGANHPAEEVTEADW
ncbi:MAG: SDR family NAD(P)-dependent oxidoreductase, partial [Acidimicrobiia bacterium]|nr:SDR family NAD(P)-dependent oxidoreductase [Acidimicrobiia bacterium]